MDKRFAMFLAACLLLWALNMLFMPPPRHPAGKEAGKAGAAAPAEPKQGGKPAAPAENKPAQEAPAVAKAKEAKKAPPAIVAAAPEQAFTLGSADPEKPYRMLVTLTTRGAAVERIEASNSPRYRDLESGSGFEDLSGLEDHSGYLGHLFLEGALRKPGCAIDVVGPGTPADKAGLKPGDVVKQISSKAKTAAIVSADALNHFLAGTKPGQMVTLTVLRRGKELPLDPVKLGYPPLQVVRPEGTDPLSFLLALYQIDKEDLSKLYKGDEKFADDLGPKGPRELADAGLRIAEWQATPPDRDHPDRVIFTRKLPKWNLEVTKTYAIEPVPAAQQEDVNQRGYHITLTVGLRNADSAQHEVAYQLDGPTGLPTEGWWYAYKVSGGLRDVIVKFFGGKLDTTISSTIADDKFTTWGNEPLQFIGVDAQYFTVAMIPEVREPKEGFQQSQPLRAGEVKDAKLKKLVDVSCRVVSLPHTLKPGDKPFEQKFVIFAGPKRPDLLARYDDLGDVVNYGWFHVIAVPMVSVLHAFYFVVRDYGVAIILLTVLVRLCMFPLSRKQALSTVKMQQLQPEIKRIQEKFKNNAEARTKAQQELWRKHNFNPLSGCLVAFIQLPIFVALYRALGVDVELRDAPLLSESIRWCSNLAAPDMLFYWKDFMPEFLAAPQGWLGPYFNILPIVTIVIFLWQQNKMMPPAADEQAAMQQKIMKFMMIFMGVMFFKVASGLCIYFIASSLWGMGERKFLPKFVHPDAAGGPPGKPPRTPPGRDKRKARR